MRDTQWVEHTPKETHRHTLCSLAGGRLRVKALASAVRVRAYGNLYMYDGRETDGVWGIKFAGVRESFYRYARAERSMWWGGGGGMRMRQVWSAQKD